jgi:hypothetical protein
MMGDPDHQQPKAEDTTAGPRSDGAPPGAIRNLILWTVSILLLAAWRAYDGFRRPEFRSNDLLHAVLILLVGALAWVRRLTRGALVIKPRWGGDMVNHWTAAFAPLLVVVGFVWAQSLEARHQAAQEKLAFKKQAWQQALRQQRNLSDLASEQFRAAIVKQGDAFRDWIETSQKLELADGEPGFRPTPNATRKLEEAKDEYNRAFERDKAERERLRRLELEFWSHRWGAF